MFIRKWDPVYEQDMETGSGGDTGGDKVIPTPPPVPADGPGSGRSKLRQQLEGNFKSAAESADKLEKDLARQTQQTKKTTKSRARQELEALEADDAELDVELEPQEQEQELVEGEKTEQVEPAVAAPKSWPKEAKAAWTGVPPVAQAAILKREQDMEKGVASLKKNYADIDAVLAPRMEIMKQQGHTPAEAVNQLWLWFDALAMDPHRLKAGQAPIALIALAHSFGIDLATGRLIGEQGDPAAQEQQGEQTDVLGDLPDTAKKYIASLEQKVNQLGQVVQGGFQNFSKGFEQQAMEKTTSIMNAWAEGKPYFEEVRQYMAHIIGSRMIPPKADGSADLDTAYNMAIYAHPEVREQVLRDRRKAALEKKKKSEEAEKRAQQEQADKARMRAGSTLKPSSPGTTFANDDKKKKSNKSVRDSLMDSIEELGGR